MNMLRGRVFMQSANNSREYEPNVTWTAAEDGQAGCAPGPATVTCEFIAALGLFM